jgi:hypothetical protein
LGEFNLLVGLAEPDQAKLKAQLLKSCEHKVGHNSTSTLLHRLQTKIEPPKGIHKRDPYRAEKDINIIT